MKTDKMCTSLGKQSSFGKLRTGLTFSKLTFCASSHLVRTSTWEEGVQGSLTPSVAQITTCTATSACYAFTTGEYLELLQA